MPWEVRGEQRYYYRTARVGGKVRKIYVGKGSAAVQAALEDEAARLRKQSERDEIRRHKEDTADAVALMQELERHSRQLTHACLLAAGYHQHRGTWRKRRDCKTP